MMGLEPTTSGTTACGLLGPKAPETTAASDISVLRLQAKFPGYTLTEYQAGESLTQRNAAAAIRSTQLRF
jgi:hypothetical protein